MALCISSLVEILGSYELPHSQVEFISRISPRVEDTSKFYTGMSYKNIIDRQLPKGKQEVSLSAFAFLFSEIIQYYQSTVNNVGELERR